MQLFKDKVTTSLNWNLICLPSTVDTFSSLNESIKIHEKFKSDNEHTLKLH